MIKLEPLMRVQLYDGEIYVVAIAPNGSTIGVNIHNTLSDLTLTDGNPSYKIVKVFAPPTSFQLYLNPYYFGEILWDVEKEAICEEIAELKALIAELEKKL